MEELKFDEITVDTKLAEAFLKENASEINMFKSGDDQQFARIRRKHLNYELRNAPREEICKLLASKMEENAELFAQLEALLRGVPKEDVINIDTKLIVQNCRYWSRNEFLRWRCCDVPIIMAKFSPLASLGAVAGVARFSTAPSIHYCDATAAVCYKFACMCFETGLDLELKCISDTEITEDRGFKNGCSAVVTEHSDIDSAVDVFLYSTSKRPWKLHRVFVQEGVTGRLKNALIAKSKLRAGNNNDTGGELNSETVAYENKLFAFDFFTEKRQMDAKHVIIIEAYRTVKELLSLIEKEDPFFLSLWTNDISEANEIAYNVRTPIVWINGYEIFSGSDRSSQAFYNAFQSQWKNKLFDNQVVENLQIWFKLSTEERMMKMMKVVQVLKSNKDVDASLVRVVENAVTNLQSDKFVEIDKGTVCIGIENFHGFLLSMYFDEDSDVPNKVMHAVTSVVYGAGCLCWWEIPDELKKILNLFHKEHIPFVDYKEYSTTSKLGYIAAFPSTRLVYTSYGTIFAN